MAKAKTADNERASGGILVDDDNIAKRNE